MNSPEPTTLLLVNAGRRVELTRALRAAFADMGSAGRILATDIQQHAPALYEADARFLLPHSSAPDFAERLADLCRRECVNLVIPLIDPDLPRLAALRDRLAGARVLVSSPRVVEIGRDKAATAAFLRENGFPTVPVLTPEEARGHSLPLFIKPRYGSASVNTYRANSLEELDFFARRVPDPVIQEFIEGDEITVDVFSDWDAVPIAAIPRRRLKVRAGEVSVGRIERDASLERLCLEIASRLGSIGPINVQVIRSAEGLRVIEINPRFGGGCPLSIAAGAPLARWTVLMARQEPIAREPLTLTDGLTMMRFDDSVFRAPGELAT